MADMKEVVKSEDEHPAGAGVQSRKKRVAYEKDSGIRSQIDKRYMKSMETRLSEWHTRTRLPVVIMALRNGEFWFATDVPQLQDFGRDPVVQEAFLKHMGSPKSQSAQRPTEAEVMPLDNTPPDEDDLSVKTVVELRKMVKTAVMADGRLKPFWGKETMKPVWWPRDLVFADVNNSKKRPRRNELIAIMQSYRNWNLREPLEDSELTSASYAGGPEVPIPVASTPSASVRGLPPPPPPEVSFIGPEYPEYEKNVRGVGRVAKKQTRRKAELEDEELGAAVKYPEYVRGVRVPNKQARKKAEQEDEELEAAVKLQSWWRGTMVRKQLGPYSKKKGKKLYKVKPL